LPYQINSGGGGKGEATDVRGMKTALYFPIRDQKKGHFQLPIRKIDVPQR
jgi:hypothetical protein